MNHPHVLLLFLSFLLLTPFTTYAYLDPGTGSFIVQILAALFLSISFFSKTFIYRLKQFIGNLFSKKQSKESSVSVEKDENEYEKESV